jgi:hypothetical protein
MSHFVGKVFTEEWHTPYLRSAAFLFCGKQDWGGIMHLWENIKIDEDYVTVRKTQVEPQGETQGKEKSELSSFVWRLPCSSLEEYSKTDPEDRIAVVPDPDFVKGYCISGKITILRGEGEVHAIAKCKNGKRKYHGDDMSYVGEDLRCHEALHYPSVDECAKSLLSFSYSP